jgi:hypothetical protein
MTGHRSFLVVSPGRRPKLMSDAKGRPIIRNVFAVG